MRQRALDHDHTHLPQWGHVLRDDQDEEIVNPMFLFMEATPLPWLSLVFIKRLFLHSRGNEKNEAKAL